MKSRLQFLHCFFCLCLASWICFFFLLLASPLALAADEDGEHQLAVELAKASEAGEEKDAKEPSTVQQAAPQLSSVSSGIEPIENLDEWLRIRAEQVLQLMDGTLDPSLDARALFRFDLRQLDVLGEDGQRLRSILSEVSKQGQQSNAKKRRRKKRRRRKLQLDKLSPDEAYRLAYREFFLLSSEERQSLLESHRQRSEQQVAEAEALQRIQTKLGELTQQADRLQAFLEGRLALELQPETLLQLDLSDESEIALSSERLAAWVGDTSSGSESTAAKAEPQKEKPSKKEGQTPEESKESSLGDLKPKLRQAQLRLDRLRKDFVERSSDEQIQLFSIHQQRIQDAKEEAARQKSLAEQELLRAEQERTQAIEEAQQEAVKAAEEREAALEAARVAKTEAARILASERARLLGIKEEQANYEAEINRRRAERGENHEMALEWSRRVKELASSSEFAPDKAKKADPLYQQIRGDLAKLRKRMGVELDRIRRAGEDIPQVGEPLDAELPMDVERGDLNEMRQELGQKAEELEHLEQVTNWELAEGLRDDVVLLNRNRLLLLTMASPALRRAVTGFGAQGIEQVRRELAQIRVELKFHALKLSSYREGFEQRFTASPVAWVLSVLKLLLLFVVYFWWRKRADARLKAMLTRLRERPIHTALVRGLMTSLWYLRRIRKPLELLLLVMVGADLVADLGGMSEDPAFRLILLSVLWVLSGLTVILWVDALAEREDLYSTNSQDTSKLRISSLRLVGLSVIVVGLILSLTSTMVGQGAIYRWVISSCWILAIPVTMYLVHRWRSIIFERISQQASQGALVQWIQKNQSGLTSFVAASLGAVVLMSSGILSWIMRQLSGLEATRRLLAYLFRREVAKQAAATEADGRFTPIEEDIKQKFLPLELSQPISESEKLSASQDVINEVGSEELERILVGSGSGDDKDAAAPARSTLRAVVGERGAGKSMFLQRVRDKIGESRSLRVQCPEAGFEALVRQLFAGVGEGASSEPSKSAAALAKILADKGITTVLVDDAQRLVVPAVNGLKALDRFVAFTREVGGEVSWVVSIGKASWHYIRRARGDRVFFETVVELPRWTEDQLGALIQLQCQRSGIDPSFQGLVVPKQSQRQFSNENEDGKDRTEAGYYRLLWDFSKGNPSVAMFAFRESLFRDPSGNIVVRLFREPPAEQIEDLSMPILLVLRSIVQLEYAVASEIRAATQLPDFDVSEAIRFCLARNYVEPDGEGLRLSWPWYRTITTVLQRQHLLSSL